MSDSRIYEVISISFTNMLIIETWSEIMCHVLTCHNFSDKKVITRALKDGEFNEVSLISKKLELVKLRTVQQTRLIY